MHYAINNANWTFKVHGTTAISAACHTYPTPRNGRGEHKKETERKR